MKRTSKWQKHLTIRELKHLAEHDDSGRPTLRGLRSNLEHQKRFREESGLVACHDCSHIANKLRDAGYQLTTNREN